jgi:transcriptional regulator with XRE-family HTH domain/tetratricopeptide (TPR) repeat protein
MSDDDVGEFAALLRACRRSAGLSQDELAERSGLNTRTVSNMERGRTRAPYRNSLHRLADALHLRDEARSEFIAAAGRRLAGTPDAPPAAGRLVPRQLPAAVTTFVGRHQQLATLSRMLREPDATIIVAIDGPAGVGKTALALHWAHRVADEFPDGQLFVDLRGFDPSGTPVTTDDAIRVLLDGLGAPPDRLPATTPAQLGLYRSLLAGKRVLVLLDNARDATQVRSLLPGSPTCGVVITSRNQLNGLVALDNATPLPLDVLDETESRQLLARRLGTERTTAEADATTQLTHRCGRLPLALCVTAARATMRPDLSLTQIAADLAATQRNLDAFTVPADPTADVRIAFSWSYTTLTPACRLMFRLLGLHPGPDISPDAAASLAAVPPEQANTLLAELTGSNLLSATRDRFALHDLLRAYAAEQAEIPAAELDRHTALRRMLDHYLTTATTAAHLLDENVRLPTQTPPAAPGVRPEALTTRTEALNWFAREYPVLLRLIDLAATTGFDVHAWQLPRTLRGHFESRALWTDWDHTHQVAAHAARRLEDSRAQALIELSWARCEIYRNDRPKAEQHLRDALDRFERLGDPIGQAHALVNLGGVAASAGCYDEAIAWASRAHGRYAETDDREGQAGSLANLGLYHLRLGHYEHSTDLLTRAQVIFDELGNRTGQALAAHNLGLAHHGAGEYRHAIACHHIAADLLHELGNVADYAEVLGELADAYHADARPTEAIATCRQALTILTELDHPKAAQMAAKLTRLRTGEPPPG